MANSYFWTNFASAHGQSLGKVTIPFFRDKQRILHFQNKGGIPYQIEQLMNIKEMQGGENGNIRWLVGV